jgi:hypothetical protein
MRAALILAVCLACLGCAATDITSKMATWEGRPISELSAAWGEPDSCSDADGSRRCSWTNQIDKPFTSLACTRTVELNAADQVVGWRWRGDRCAEFESVIVANTAPARPQVLPSEENDNRVVDAEAD